MDELQCILQSCVIQAGFEAQPHLFSFSLLRLSTDMLEVWTNGTYKSTLHRVLTSSDCDRYSIPFFFNPKYETAVECLECCTDENNPPLYPPTTAGKHIFDKYVETHADFEPEEKQEEEQ